MKIVVLGESPSPITTDLRLRGHAVLEWADPIDTDFLQREGVEFLVSYRYRHILRTPVLDCLPGRAVNLHISLLPWNRGADPNLWSFLENTPKGFTIHFLDAGVDTGDIIAQRELKFDSRSETLASTYRKLNDAIVQLFLESVDEVLSGACPRIQQRGRGTCHRMSDKVPYAHLLTEGWDTPVWKLEGKGIERNKS